MCHPRRANKRGLFALRCEKGVGVTSVRGVGDTNARRYHGVWEMACLEKLQENHSERDPLND